MPKITIRLSDEEYEKIQSAKGEQTITAFCQELIISNLDRSGIQRSRELQNTSKILKILQNSQVDQLAASVQALRAKLEAKDYLTGVGEGDATELTAIRLAMSKLTEDVEKIKNDGQYQKTRTAIVGLADVVKTNEDAINSFKHILFAMNKQNDFVLLAPRDRDFLNDRK